jgi:hypothetical protein
MSKKPTFLYRIDAQYPMKLQDGGYYETEQPPTSVPKIGVKSPQKRKFTLEQLLELGWEIRRIRTPS